VTGVTVCTANNTDVYLLSGTTLGSTIASDGVGFNSFSGGFCTTCGVAMDAVHNKAVIGIHTATGPGFQFLDLPLTAVGATVKEPAFKSQNTLISEDLLIDPINNQLLSAAENGNYEIIDVTTSMSPAFFENATVGGTLDSSGEDCSTRIALAPKEFSGPSSVVYIADLKQAVFTPGSPAGTWTATLGVAAQNQSLTGSFLAAGASGIAVAQGTHTGVVAGEFAGVVALTAIGLPSTSGAGLPAIGSWMTCGIGGGFSNGLDPHTVTAYQFPTGTGDAFALLANAGATMLAKVDLTLMLALPETFPGSHVCASGTLPATVVTLIPIP